MDDTITAISTALGVGAISIIRVSGEKSIEIVNKIFTKDISNVESHTIHYGYIKEKDKKIDEVLVSVMKSPKTFTTEDVVEINCHGGIATTNKVLELLLENGARLAEPGEFTKRAFLNGRIDLIEAEGIMDLISSKTEKSRELSINRLSGEVSEVINALRNELVGIISNIEVNIDYPEYDDIEVLTNDKILPNIELVIDKINKILKKQDDGKIIEDGIKVAIIGKPNVGKSSLLNKLLEEDKAIVTDIAGTTRDIVEGKLVLNGIILNIIDTAGIRETDNVVEKIGVEKSISLIEKSDLVILILNNNEDLDEENEKLLDSISNKKSIVLINKIDLENKLDYTKLKENYIKMSVKENKGIDELKKRIIDIFNLENIETKDMTYLNNKREINLLKESLKSLNEALDSIKNNEPIDIVEIEVKNAWEYLSEILGESYKEELIDEMFKRFCLGK